MKHIISNTQIKNNDWKVVSLQSDNGQSLQEVSVNRSNKKGEVFPNFDGVVDGATVEGELWQSGAGKWYLFAPRQGNLGPKPAWVGRSKPDIAKMVEKKNENIKQFAENKNEAIMISSSIRMATDITVARMAQSTNREWQREQIEEEIEMWRKWFISIWEPSA